MSAKILIMSGARAGEEVLLDQDEFRAGGQSGCEVYFDAAQDPGAQGRAAGFQRKDEGWFVRNVGTGQIWLNAEPVAAQRQIRSGDIVRMSDDGPDLEFTIVSRSAQAGKIQGEIVFDKDGRFTIGSGSTQPGMPAAAVSAQAGKIQGEIAFDKDGRYTIVGGSAQTGKPTAALSAQAGKIQGEIVFDKDGRRTIVGGSAQAARPAAALVADSPVGVQSPLTPGAAGPPPLPAAPLASAPFAPAPAAPTPAAPAPAAPAPAAPTPVLLDRQTLVEAYCCDLEANAGPAPVLVARRAPGRRRLTPTALIAAGAAAILLALFFLLHTRGSLPALKLQSVPEKTAEVGSPVQFRVRVSDPAWEKKVRFGFGDHAPAGAAIDGNTGEFSWTPTKTGEFEFRVEAVALDGSQQQSDTSLAFHVAKAKDKDVAPPPSASIPLAPLKFQPVEDWVGPRAAGPNKPFRVPVPLESAGMGAGKLHYSLSERPPGADVVEHGGVAAVEWTPGKEHEGKTWTVRVQVADSANRSDAVAFRVEVRQEGPGTGPVLLLQVENEGAGATWPFATGLAVGKNLVLTSGAAACYLEDFRQKQYKVWATHEAGPLKVEVGQIRVHARYLQLLKAVRDPKNSGDLKELRCFDLALLTTKGELPQAAPLASPEDMAKLADGYPLVLLGYTFNKGQKMTEFF